MKTDLEIQNDVIEELKWQPFLNSAEIGVAVKTGIVTLSGSVDTYSKKTAAENAVKKVSGVKIVVEEIEVILPGSSRRTDTDIAEAVLNALKWNTAMREHKISVNVESGVVTLEGEVEWEFQRDSARSMVESIMGVRSVMNRIKIKTKVTPGEIKQKIADAFHRSATLDSENISVEILGNKAILRGKVGSWAEKDDAEKTVWAATGIEKVDNRLEIDTEVFVF